jgi:hypothetical protein
MLGDFTAKVGGKDIILLTIGKKSLHEIYISDGVCVVTFTTPKRS